MTKSRTADPSRKWERRTARCCLVAAAMLLAAWFASELWWARWYEDPWLVGLHRGGVSVEHALNTKYRMPPGWLIGRRLPSSQQSFGSFDAKQWLPRVSSSAGRTLVIVPFWVPTAAVLTCLGLISGRAWRRRRQLAQQVAAGIRPCPTCGYNLAGLKPGSACPECGNTS